MGCCLSKTTPPPLPNAETETTQPESTVPQNPQPKLENDVKDSVVSETDKKEDNKLDQEEFKEKKQFMIPPRKSQDKSSESKELIQSTISSEPEANNPKSKSSEGIASNIMAMAANGTVVRTSSCTKEEVDAILIQCGRLSRSGSNRKYSGSKRSHDFDKENSSNNVSIEVNCDDENVDERQRRRQSRGSHRRTTPSRSRERDPQSQKSGGGRRLSRSPAKRSESPNNKTGNSNTNTSNGGRPGKMVSVPARVASLSMDKSSNGDVSHESVKRVLVKRNLNEGLSGSRAATPPRSRSPARSAVVGGLMKGVNEGTRQNQPSPNRNSSRKTDQSPYRRTPLTDLDMNSLPFPATKGQLKQQPVSSVSQKGAVQGSHRRVRSRGGGEGSELLLPQANLSQTNAEQPKLTRSRSSRQSRDLDVNSESLTNPNSTTNYTSLLLQDIQNFHQKAASTTSFKLPECISKACSIVEAVADLNLNSSTKAVGRVNDEDELMEPSLHKFVTVRKRGIDGEFDEQEESSGSNSFVVGGGSVSLSCSEGVSPVSFQRSVMVSSTAKSGASRPRAGPGR